VRGEDWRPLPWGPLECDGCRAPGIRLYSPVRYGVVRATIPQLCSGCLEAYRRWVATVRAK